MIAHTEFQQGSLEWMEARAGIPTASEFKQLVTPKWEIRKGQMPITYLCSKLAERWLQTPLQGWRGPEMDIGHILEDEAIPRYELDFSCDIQRVGFITTDDGKIGCSPDGLIGEDGGIEIKCPQPQTHVDYLLGGQVVPDEYLAQVHGSLYVTGRPWWAFMSYCRNLPALYVRVNRDERIIATLDEALENFLARFDHAYEFLVKTNGGPPRKRERLQTSDGPVKMSWELNPDDVPT